MDSLLEDEDLWTYYHKKSLERAKEFNLDRFTDTLINILGKLGF
jgi:hypothetical protein